MDSKEPKATLEEKERLKLRRQKWIIERELEKKHEERKRHMIAEYERKRAKNHSKQRSPRRSKSNNPQLGRIISTDDKHSEEFGASRFKYEKDTIIDEKELHKIKIDIYKQKILPITGQSSSKNKIERDIVNFDEIVLPRRKDEGCCPIFERNQIKVEETRKMRTITLLPDDQSETQLSTIKERAYICRRSPDDRYSRYDNRSYSDFKPDRPMRHRDHRTSDNNGCNSDRNSPIKNSRDDTKRRHQSHSSSTERTIRDQSNSRRRSRNPLTSRQMKERKISNDESKSSKRDIERPNFSGSYNTYMRFPRSMPIFGIQAPPVIWPVAPGMFSVPFPAIPPNMNRWQPPPPRFANFVRRAHWNPRRHRQQY